VNWAKENDIEFPAELAEKVIGRSGKLLDWKGEYENLKTQYDDHTGEWKKIVEKQHDALETYRQRIEHLESECVSACNFDPLRWGIGVQN
jgi:hypothetical protein